MIETALLNQLQMKRRELENEVASLSQREASLKGELQKLEEGIIAELEETIRSKKLVLSSLESQKRDLEKKLNEVQGKPEEAKKPEEPPATIETAQQEDSNVEISVVEGQAEQIEESPRQESQTSRFF